MAVVSFTRSILGQSTQKTAPSEGDEEAQEVLEDPMAEAEKKKEKIAFGKKPVDEEVQAYFDDQAKFFKELEKAQNISI